MQLHEREGQEHDGVVAAIEDAVADLRAGSWVPGVHEMLLADQMALAVADGRPWSGLRRGIVAAVVELGPDADIDRLGVIVVAAAGRLERYELAAAAAAGVEPSGSPDDAVMLARLRDLLAEMWLVSIPG